MSELVGGKIGEKVGYSLELVEGNLKLSGKFDGPGVDVELAIISEPSVFLDKLKAVIPGQIDDAIIDALKGAFLK